MGEIERDFKRKLCDEVGVEHEGLDRYVVYTPFTFDDGDHFVTVLKRRGDRWVLTDEGHTFMHMSYADVDLTQGTRKSIIDQSLLNFRLVNESGELCLEVPDEEFGDALFTFIQALTKISDTAYWTRERVKSAFMDNFREFLAGRIPSPQREFDYFDRERDPDRLYLVDCRVNGTARPLFIFGITSDSKCKDATIIINQFEKWGEDFRSMAIFEDQTQINSKALARFSDVTGKLFSSLQNERIGRYLREQLGLGLTDT